MVTDPPIDAAMEPPLEPEGPSSSYVPPVVDESRDLQLGWQDAVFGFLTLPLLFWALMYAVSGAEQWVATPRARMKLYGVLLALELLIVLVIAFMVTR